jgi:hypothetical protein
MTSRNIELMHVSWLVNSDLDDSLSAADPVANATVESRDPLSGENACVAGMWHIATATAMHRAGLETRRRPVENASDTISKMPNVLDNRLPERAARREPNGAAVGQSG